MARDTKILQAILDNQSSLSQKIDNLDKKMTEGFKKVNKRIDSVGSHVAYLEDDTPTRKEHDKLEKRVTKIETKLASA